MNTTEDDVVGHEEKAVADDIVKVRRERYGSDMMRYKEKAMENDIMKRYRGCRAE